MFFEDAFHFRNNEMTDVAQLKMFDMIRVFPKRTYLRIFLGGSCRKGRKPHLLSSSHHYEVDVFLALLRRVMLHYCLIQRMIPLVAPFISYSGRL